MTASGISGRTALCSTNYRPCHFWKCIKGTLETVWYWPLRLGRKEEWKLQPSECNCLALSLPNTPRAYKHQWREKGLISKDIRFSELCDLWKEWPSEKTISWNSNPGLGNEATNELSLSLFKMFAHQPFPLDLDTGEKKSYWPILTVSLALSTGIVTQLGMNT